VRLARRLAAVPASATVAISARARALAASGRDIIALSAGEPDLAPPAGIVEATIAALERGEVRYGSVGGLTELRAAVAERFSAAYRLPWSPDRVAITCGGKEALLATFFALVEPGDEVLVPAPHWVSTPAQITLAGGVPVPVPMDPADGFALSASALARSIGPRTRGLVLNSPNNPTGAVYDEAGLAAVAELARAHGLWLVSDDIYAGVRYDDLPFASILHVAPDLVDRVVVVHGVSKTWGMTGYRVGFLGGPAPFVRACLTWLGQATTHPTLFAQHGALAAVRGDDAFLAGWIRTFDRRRRALHARLDALEGVSTSLPGGAFYLFPDVRGLLALEHAGERIDTDARLAELLLEGEGVAVVPGVAFGAPGFVRLSYTAPLERLEEAASRIARFVGTLTP